ncbi:MAG TPA: heme ABC transporter permease CcmC [Burkholderiaceae bacterium]|nr:heme ABC transporter permease CcmC [Burkholderiaceae bacterium]
MKTSLFHFASPATFEPLARRVARPAAWLSALLAAAGLVVGLAIAPADAVQGEAYRIIFVHVPAAWMSMLIYVVMAGYALAYLVLNVRLAGLMVRALAPTGAMFTFVALATGSLWGRPTWGTYWVWDARLTSELILMFMYIGLMLLHGAIPDPRRADRAGALLALVGVVNVPVIYFSVQWWNTLHQGASISLTRAPTMAHTMLAGLLLMTASAWLYAIAVALTRARRLLAERSREAAVPAMATVRWAGSSAATSAPFKGAIR